MRFYHDLQSHVMGEVAPSPLQACLADEVEVFRRCLDWLERLRAAKVSGAVMLLPGPRAGTKRHSQGVNKIVPDTFLTSDTFCGSSLRVIRRGTKG